MEYASVKKRIGAFLIDCVVLGISGILVYLAVLGICVKRPYLHVDTLASFFHSQVYTLVSILFYLAAALIMGLVEAGYNKGTVGKVNVHLIVTKHDGTKAKASDTIARNFAKVIPLILISLFPRAAWVFIILTIISFVCVVGDDKNRAIHDRLSGTVVIIKGSERTLTAEKIRESIEKKEEISHKSTEPVASVSVNKPVVSIPVTEPVASIPVTEPVASIPVTEPVASIPVTEPVIGNQ